MAGSFTDYTEAAVLEHLLGGVAFTAAAKQYVALYTVTPSDTGGGTEVTGGDYARVEVANNTTTWPTATGTNPTSKANGIAITFPTATASWGTVVAFGVFDDTAVTPNLLFYGTLGTSQSVPSGVTLSFPIGNLTCTLS